MKIPLAIAAALVGTMILPAADFGNRYVTMTIDEKGCLSSLREKAGGRELVGEKLPFVEVRDAANRAVAPVAMTAEGDRLTFAFAQGSCVVRLIPFDGGWTVESVSCDVPGAERLVLAQVKPSCNERKGDMSNAVLDDRSGVCVRGYRPEVRMTDPDVNEVYTEFVRSRKTCAWVDRAFGFAGHRAGLAAGPSAKLPEMLGNMAVAGDCLRTACGGPWSLRSDANRASYMFGTWMDAPSVDDWLRLMDKSGCRIMHFHAWWKTRGHYAIDPACFPGGMPQFEDVCRRFKARGKRLGIHTLSAAVQFGDPFIDPKWFDDYETDAEYTLARPYRRGDTELYVNEKPSPKHAKILTGSTNGNILRLGDNLLQYSDFTTEPPYRFTGVRIALAPYGEEAVYDDTQAVQTTREAGAAEAGAAKRVLTRAEYPAGHAVSYLHHRYAEFSPKPGSKLAEATTDCIADVFNRCGMEEIFFDGMEVCNSPYSVDWLRDRTFAKFKQPATGVISGSSMRSADNWWYRSQFGYWDHPKFLPKVFHARHIAAMASTADTEFLRTDLGWWNIRAGNAAARSYFPDEAEYFGCKCAAEDATTSIHGLSAITDGPLKFVADLQLTITGWWENLRYLRAFKPGLQARMRDLATDWRLRQDGTGAWCVAPYETHKHAVPTADFARWTETCAAARPAEIRVEALYAADRKAGATNVVRVLDASTLDAYRTLHADGMELAVAKGSDAKVGETVRLTATNVSAPRKGSWAAITRAIPIERMFKVRDVSTLWVKGDGSGAVVNFQIETAPEYGHGFSENFVRLDFTGWRRVELLLREPDGATSTEFDWPYDYRLKRNGHGEIFRTGTQGRPLKAISVYMSNVAQGRSATVEFGAWDSIPMTRETMAANAAVTLNGTAFALPFALTSGEYAELVDGAWTHYSEVGEPIERIAANARPQVKAGANELAFTPHPSSPIPHPSFPRVEVTLFALGEPEPATGALTDEQKRELSVEYELPQIFNPAKGLVADCDVKVRPGETAKLGFEILGPAKNPVVAGEVIPVTLETSADKIVSEDGATWTAVRVIPGRTGDENRLEVSQRQPLGEGKLAKPLVLKGGTTRVTYASERPGSRVTFVKKYEEAK